MNNTKPLVSIVCFAYNQEKYIENALEGFVMQKTDFHFEIIIHDDASTDNTANIVREYESKYPDLFKPIYQKENQYSQEKGRVTQIALNKVEGKYIALCEGDDYWIDPLKLQKQVDFLEKNRDYTICTHDYTIHYEHKDIPDRVASKIFPYLKTNPILGTNIFEFDIVKFAKYLDGWHTATNLMRFDFFKQNYKFFKNGIVSGDYLLKILALKEGKGAFIADNMSVLRKNPGGITQQKVDILKNFNMQRMQLNYFVEITPNIARKYFYRRLWRIYPNFLLGRKGYDGRVPVVERIKTIPEFLKSLFRSI